MARFVAWDQHRNMSCPLPPLHRVPRSRQKSQGKSQTAFLFRVILSVFKSLRFAFTSWANGPSLGSGAAAWSPYSMHSLEERFCFYGSRLNTMKPLLFDSSCITSLAIHAL